MGKRLARSRDEKMVCGVAAGLARYFDPVSYTHLTLPTIYSV